MKLIQTWGKVQRPWGWELRCDFSTPEGQIINEVMTFEKEPDQSAIDCKLAETQKRLESLPSLPKEGPGEISNPEVESLRAENTALKSQVSSLQTELSAAKKVVIK